MAPDLRDLIERTVAQPPLERHPVDTVVRRAERARLRHRVWCGTGGALAVLLVAGVGVAVVRFGADPDRVGDPQAGVVGPVLHLDDATPGVAGRDYDELASYTARDLDQGNDRLYTDVAPTGEVLVSDPQRLEPGNELSEYDRYGLITPGSARVRWLPEPPDAHFSTDFAPSGPNVVDVTADTVVWLDAAEAERTGRWQVDLYDRGARTWTSLDLRVGSLPGGRGPTYGNLRLAAGRLWFVLDEPAQRKHLWSVADDGAGPPRDEGLVGDWDVDDGRLVWTSRHNARADTFSVRDFKSGRVQTYPTRSGARCNQLGLGLAGDRVALTEYCGTRHRVRDDRVHVVSTDGEQVLTVQGDGIDSGVLGDDLLEVAALGSASGSTAGTYVYDFGSERLRQISSGVGRYGVQSSAGRSTIVWATPINESKGQTMHAAVWR